MKRLFLCSIIGLAAACTQNPAEVDYKGDEFYGRVPEAASSPSTMSHSVKRAQVQSVGVSDLPAPPQASNQQVASNDLKPLSPPQAAKPKTDQFIWPVAEGKIISHFGPKAAGRSNDGINIAVSEGEPIWAAAGGTVVYAGSDLKGYGNMVIIRHSDGWMTAYAHARSIAVKKDGVVKQGDIIGYVGMTGGVKSPQLHFAIRDGRTPVDPELYLPKNNAG